MKLTGNQSKHAKKQSKAYVGLIALKTGSCDNSGFRRPRNPPKCAAERCSSKKFLKSIKN